MKRQEKRTVVVGGGINKAGQARDFHLNSRGFK